MKCLIITPWCYDLELDKVKGTPENAYLKKELEKRGIEIEVLCPKTPHFPKIKKGKLSFIAEGCYDRHIFKLIKDKNFDFAISITGLGARALKKTKKPFFIKYLGVFDFFLIRGIKRYLYHRRLYISAKTKPLGIVMTDDGTKGHMAVKEAGYKGDVLFLKNGYFKGLLNIDRVNDNQDVINIGFASSLELIKGIDFFISIINNLIGREKFRFIIAGDGTYKEKIEELSARYPNRVKYMGYLPYLKMPEFYKNIDILLSLNRYSNGTLPVVEAQAAGIPVIAFDIQDTSKFIKHNVSGFLAEPFDIKSIVFLLKTLRKKQILGMKNNTMQFAENTFMDMEKRAKMEVDFYLERLNEGY